MASEDAMLWIEVLSRNDEVLARHRVRPGSEVRIGRGYDNDVILDDPYVAARHLRIVRDLDGTLVAEDLGSVNGLLAGDDPRRVDRAVLDGQGSITVGRTRLRVRAADHQVEPERALRPRMRSWPLIALFAPLLLGAELLTTWLDRTTEDKLAEYLTPLLALCLFVAAWTTLWAVLSRIFAGRARYERHLLIALCGLLAFAVLSELSALAAFALSRRELVTYVYIVMWLLGGFVCFLHLRQLSASREAGQSRLKLKAGAAAVMALLGIGMQSLWQWEASASADRQSYVRDLQPPPVRLVAAQSETGFFAEVSKIKLSLDRARAERPGRVWPHETDDD